MKALLEKIRKILRSRRTRQLLTRAVSGVAAIVVFITTYALVLPAITMEQDAFCGIPEHQHTDACYEERLVCEIPEGEEHHHDASCYEKFLICGKEVHTHSTECYQKDNSAVVSSGSGAAASTALEAFAEPDAYETGVNEFASGAAVMDSAADSGSLSGEPAQEDAVSEQVVSEGTDEEEGVPEKINENVSETVPDASDNVGNGLEDTEHTEQESPTGIDDSNLAADSGQDLEGTDLETSGSGNSENIDADTTTPEDAESIDSEEDKAAVDVSEDGDTKSTEQVNEEDEDLGLEAGNPMDMNEDSVSGSDTLDKLDTMDTSDHAAEDTDGAETEDTAPAAGTEEAANDATTNVLPEPVETEKLSSGYVPELDSIEFGTVLNKHTDFFYFRPEEGQELPASSAEVTDWKKVKNGFFGSTKLESTDLVKMYLSYTIPAGALNETNQVARYRLPSNIHLTDDQIIAINATENGMSALYADAVTKEGEGMADEGNENIAEGEGDEARAEELESDGKAEDSAEDAGTASGTDEGDGADIEAASDTSELVQDENTANYQKYLGAEAIEGTRTPDETLKEGAQEYISAIVKAENVFDEEGRYGEKGAFLGQDLIFIFTPYSIEKNQTIYNTDGEPVSAGEKITGWFACDFNMSQIDWVEEDTDLDNSTLEKTAEIVFVEKDSEKNVKEISRKLKLVDVTGDQSDAANGGETAAAAETAATAEIAATAATASETAATDETALASTGNTSEQAVPEDTEDGPFKSGTLTADGDGYRITLDYTEEAKIPENAELSVREITAETDREAYEACLEQAGQQVAADDKTSVDQKASRFFDIEILVKDTDGEGKEETRKIEPAAPVSVNIQILENPVAEDDAASMDKETSQSEPAVLHFAEEGVEQIDSKVKISEEQDDNRDRSGSEEPEPATEISFEAESFSIYGVVYTVDFRYEVSGEMYDFSIPGGGFVSLEHVVEVLGIASADDNKGNGAETQENGKEDGNEFVGEVPGVDESSENGEGSSDKSDDGGASPSLDSTAYEDTIKLNEAEVSEATKRFVADVKSAEFSNSELVWVGKVEEDTTVRELKESKELEVKYSGELTVKDISKINAQKVEAGDWVLISVQPFEDEQTLTVTMKDGEIFTIQVAGQVHSDDVRVQYSSADGDTIVTACASVGTLPEGTKIQIRGIDPYTDFSDDIEEEAELYAEACGAVANKLWQEHRTLSEAKVVDISFIDVDGNKIEPKGDVDVSLLLAKALKTVDEGDLGLAHIPGGEDAEVELLKANIDGCETVFSSDAFSIYVIFNGDPYTGTLQPVNFDVGWISFGGDMQARSELPNGRYDRGWNIYPSPEGAWKWLTVNLYELKDGVSEDAYNNFNNYNLLDTYSYIAGNTDIVVEDYNFRDRELLCTRFRRTNSADWIFYDAKNGVETKVNYGGAPVQYGWTDIVPGWSGYWHLAPNILNIYLTREKEVVREPSTDYVIRYYHADGTYDTMTGSLTSSNPSLRLPADYKIIDGKEIFSGLSIGAGHSALSADTSTGEMTISYHNNVSLVKANVYYKANIEIKDGGPVNGQPLYDTKTENGRKIYDTSRTGLHTDKTATLVTNSANSDLNDGRTFNLTLESWNVGANYANVGMILDASGSMVWPSDLPEEVTVPKSTLSSYGSKTTKNIKTGNGSLTTSVTGYFLTVEQVNNILNTNYVDNSKLGYNGYRYYLKDPAANVNEYVPLGYYDGTSSNGVNFSPNGNGTRGWYYVTSADVVHYQDDGTGKQYCRFPNNDDAWQGAGSTATQFWLDDEGVLHGYWYRSSGGNYYWNSKVFVSPANADNKSEVLQYGLGRFAATLLANSPTSQISMVRFSRARKNNYFTAGELALLNWTTDTKLITSALNQQYGGGTSTGHDTQNGLKVYNYGFTGDTSTGSGIDAYINDLTKKAAGNYVATSGNANNSKYLIIFTDGKDTDPATSNNNYRFNRATSKNEATNLKNQGYTIFTVMMQSAGMSTSDVADAEDFLRGLAGTKTENGDATNSDGSDKYYFNFMYDDPTALVEAFQKIAKEIAKPLDGYMVRDYIDPRFDLLDADGTVLTRLNRNGVWMPRFITTADGKTALLKYDTAKEMFYLEIEKQSIPTSPQNATDVTVNTVQLTVRAKDDFIGGNDILSNGNEDGQNQVFKPVDDYAIEVNEPVAANPDTSTYPKKDYPKTTTNPATYGTTLLNYEDTIFLNETISPIDLFGQVSTMDDETADDNHLNVYAGYLSRAGKRLHDDENYYVNILQNGVLPGGHQNVNGEVITTTDKIVTIILPYYYLKDENNIRSYAGGNLHQGDKVGTITYTWKAINTGGHTLTDNIAFKDYMSTTLDTVKYQLSISYTPDPVVSNDNIANNGSARTLALTNQTGTDKLIRDPVGNVAVSQSTDTDSEGLAVIHVEGGKIGITKKISKQDLDDKGITVSDLPNVTFTITKDGTSYKTVTAVMSQSILSNGYYELTVWETDLPKGTYTVSEVAGDGYKLDSFDAVTVQDDSSTTAVNESQFAAKYSKDSDSKTVTWYIGPKEEAADRQPDVSTYSDCVNGTVLFPYNLVADSVYHVDPDLAADNGKHYLNGQIGQAVYINKLNPLVMLRKADMTNTSKPVNGAEFSFYKEVEEETAGALTDVISGKSVTAVSEVTSGEYIQMQGADQGENLAGYVSLGDLDTDGTYYLVEKSVPDGYISPEWKYVKINLTDTQISWAAYKEDGSIYGSPQSASKETVDGKKCFTVTILNNPGVSLPNTGGPGTTALYFIGMVLTGFAGVGLVMKRKMKVA